MQGKTKKLNSGYDMPVVGLGTWQIKKDNIENSIRSAIKSGYRHIDTALLYDNEVEIGKSLTKIFSENIITRDEMFITSKLWNSHHNIVEDAVRKSLKNLNIEYLDLYLVHWPVTFKNDKNNPLKPIEKDFTIENFDCLEVWKRMEELVEKKLVRSIGVSNFGIKNLNLILKNCKIKPAVNQFECNPYMSQEELVNFCHKNTIQVVSHTSLGSNRNSDFDLKKDNVLTELSKKNNVSVPQLILSWLVMRGIMVIPKSETEKHIKSNISLKNLNKDDFNKINELNKNFRSVPANTYGDHKFD